MATDERGDRVLVNHMSLEPGTLRRLIEEFVTRDGTDYGEAEVSLDQRVSNVLSQLMNGKAAISFDMTTGSSTIVLASSRS